VTSPTGIWYLVEPKRGLLAHGRAHMQRETAPGRRHRAGPDQAVLAVTMDHGFEGLLSSSPSVGDDVDGPGRIRTCDLGIKSPLLYQLSYRPAAGERSAAP
jgi:hypothetical protein